MDKANGDGDAQMEFGRELRDDGIHLVLSHTPLEWRIGFWRAIESFKGQFRGITSEDIRAVCGPPPNHHNALPAAIMKAVTKGALISVGRMLATRSKRHAGKIDIYVVNRDFDFDGAIAEEMKRDKNLQHD